jgi:hypothetical protein
MTSTYWEENVNEALCEVGAFELLTREQRAELASLIAGAAEVEHEICGHDQIPHPAYEEAAKPTARAVAAGRRVDDARGELNANTANGFWVNDHDRVRAAKGVLS